MIFDILSHLSYVINFSWSIGAHKIDLSKEGLVFVFVLSFVRCKSHLQGSQSCPSDVAMLLFNVFVIVFV